MVEFKATQLTKEVDPSGVTLTTDISVDCPSGVSWSCVVNGNFQLNKYKGTGETTLSITVFGDDNKTAYGDVVFTYLDGKCLETFKMPVFYSEEDAWIVIYPEQEEYTKFIENEYKVFTIRSNQDDIKVNVPYNFKYFITDNNKLYLIKVDDVNSKIKLTAGVFDNKATVTVEGQ